jgi:predicted unusual protein kinase regulating ubiquinone biosynthesis (AarF/ABC1/UbiB family)
MKSAAYIRRYKEIGRLFWKYGRSDLARGLGVTSTLDTTETEATKKGVGPEDLAADLEAMGPTYVKLAQILSGRSDLLPLPYVQALARLQDRVKPFPFAQVEEIVASELGVRISKAFSYFAEVPIAAASLGQVHAAALRDGRPVAVKVQRPEITQQIAEDFEVLAQITGFLDGHTNVGRRHRFSATLDEFKITIQQELDYQREAQNLLLLGKNLEEFDLIRIPRPVLDYCTTRVLTMDYVDGCKITALSPLARLELNGTQLASQLFSAYLKQVLLDGVFHADPHPGNVFLTDDGHIALIDLGMVGHTTPGMRESLLQLLLAVSERDSEAAADIVVGISQKSEEFDRVEFRRRLGQLMALQQDQGLQQLNVGRSLLEVSRNASDNGLMVPSELTLLGKTLLQLDEVGKVLDPTFDPNSAIKRDVSELTWRRMKASFNQQTVFNSVLEAKGFMKSLPARINKLMDSITNAEFEVRVKAVDTLTLMEGIQKIANRITAGIVLAALIVGAALLTRVQTRFELFGYPGLAMMFFLAAMTGGFWLLLNIFMQDRKRGRKPH